MYDRRNQPRLMGSTLEKPTILLNRQFIQETTMGTEDRYLEDLACMDMMP